ncbi:uncharacterized protein WM277_016092 isoform 1-T2 [Molossus nigricans]
MGSLPTTSIVSSATDSQSLPLSLGRVQIIRCISLSNGQAETGPCVTVVDDFPPCNRKHRATLAALQVEPADQVKVTPWRTHRPRTPRKKIPFSQVIPTGSDNAVPPPINAEEYKKHTEGTPDPSPGMVREDLEME